MQNRQDILNEAKKQGLVQYGYHFVDYQHGIMINSAYLISCVRKLMETMTLEEAVSNFIEREGKKKQNAWSAPL